MTVQLNNVQVLNNPAPFTSDFKFVITFDCVEPGLKEELEWKLIYVGSADCEDNDQELDAIVVGPVRVGKNRFLFEAPSPDLTKIPESDLLDVTVLLLTCSYKEQEFIRIGYYVHNEYSEDIDSNDDKMTIDPQKITRNILADKPRVTRFGITWDGEEEEKENVHEPDEPQYEEADEEVGNEEDKEEEEEDEDEEDEEDEEGSVDLEGEEDLDETEEADRVGQKSKDSKMKEKGMRSGNGNTVTMTGNETDQDIDMQ